MLAAADIALIGRMTVSPGHAVVHRADGRYLVDLAPMTPIFVDGALVGVEPRLHSGAACSSARTATGSR
jgi:hypothetical protein